MKAATAAPAVSPVRRVGQDVAACWRLSLGCPGLQGGSRALGPDKPRELGKRVAAVPFAPKLLKLPVVVLVTCLILRREQPRISGREPILFPARCCQRQPGTPGALLRQVRVRAQFTLSSPCSKCWNSWRPGPALLWCWWLKFLVFLSADTTGAPTAQQQRDSRRRRGLCRQTPFSGRCWYGGVLSPSRPRRAGSTGQGWPWGPALVSCAIALGNVLLQR